MHCCERGEANSPAQLPNLILPICGRPKYIFNNSINVELKSTFYSTEVWSITITEILKLEGKKILKLDVTKLEGKKILSVYKIQRATQGTFDI